MIKINFAHRLKSPLSLGPKAGGLAGIKFNKELLSALPWGNIIVFIVVLYAAGYGVDEYKAKLIAEKDVIIDDLSSQKKKLEGKLNEQKNLEALKNTIEKDEQTIKGKLEVISRLMKDRDAPSKLLIELSRVIPAEVWLANFKVDDVTCVIGGSAIGFNQLSDFMRNLRTVPYFQDVTLNQSQAVAAKVGEVTTFDLTIKRRPLQ